MIRWQGITIDRRRRAITHNGDSIYLSPHFFRLACALLLAGPMTKPNLFDLVYDEVEDGGPLSGVKIIDVMVCQIKPKLGAVGLKMCTDGERNWWNKRYWAEPILAEALEAAE
jgi:DNA-binding response OmpR family regulator